MLLEKSMSMTILILLKSQPNDVFLYLDKRSYSYAFAATGIVSRISRRPPTEKDANHNAKVRAVFTAHLKDVHWFAKPLSISPSTPEGKRNRAVLGIRNVNLLGWSQSMPRINEAMYSSVLDLADTGKHSPAKLDKDYTVEDRWSKTKVRKTMVNFSKVVLNRHNYTCAVCGTRLRAVLEVAHLSSYSTDKKKPDKSS